MLDLDKENVLVELGKKYNKSVYQIVLRWHIQKGVIIIPKSVRIEKMKENFEIFDFNLTDDEMNQIDKLDGTKKRIQTSDEELEKELTSYVLND